MKFYYTTTEDNKMMRTPPLSPGQRVYLLDLLKKYLPPTQHKKLPDSYSSIRKTPLSAVYDSNCDKHQPLLRPLFFSTLRQDGPIASIEPTRPRELVKIILSDWLPKKGDKAAASRPGHSKSLKLSGQPKQSRQSEMFRKVRSE